MSGSDNKGSAEAPGHTDLMLPPEEIDRLLDKQRLVQSLRSFADYLPGEYEDIAQDLQIAADIIEGVI